MQIFLTNKFLSYNFLGYGVRVWAYYSQPAEERRHGAINPICETFPRLVSCDYVRYIVTYSYKYGVHDFPGTDLQEERLL